MTDAPTYGSRFLDAWKRYATTLSLFDFATIQRMREADREDFIALARERSPLLPYATIQLLRESEPEEAARILFARAGSTGQASQGAFWMILAIT